MMHKPGHKVTAATARKISMAKQGKPSPATAARNRARVWTAESRAKAAKAHSRDQLSPLTLQRMSAASRGRKVSDATIAKIVAAHKGTKHTEETKTKMREAALRLNRKGAASPSWKGGVAELNMGLRKALMGRYRYQHWKRTVLLRDNFTCQGCGAIGAVVVHHIKPFQQLVDEFGITNGAQADACVPLWDEANGVTLCHTCHTRVHKKESS